MRAVVALVIAATAAAAPPLLTDQLGDDLLSIAARLLTVSSLSPPSAGGSTVAAMSPLPPPDSPPALSDAAFRDLFLADRSLAQALTLRSMGLLTEAADVATAAGVAVARVQPADSLRRADIARLAGTLLMDDGRYAAAVEALTVVDGSVWSELHAVRLAELAARMGEYRLSEALARLAMDRWRIASQRVTHGRPNASATSAVDERLAEAAAALGMVPEALMQAVGEIDVARPRVYSSLAVNEWATLPSDAWSGGAMSGAAGGAALWAPPVALAAQPPLRPSDISSAAVAAFGSAPRLRACESLPLGEAVPTHCLHAAAANASTALLLRRRHRERGGTGMRDGDVCSSESALLRTLTRPYLQRPFVATRRHILHDRLARRGGSGAVDLSQPPAILAAQLASPLGARSLPPTSSDGRVEDVAALMTQWRHRVLGPTAPQRKRGSRSEAAGPAFAGTWAGAQPALSTKATSPSLAPSAPAQLLPTANVSFPAAALAVIDALRYQGRHTLAMHLLGTVESSMTWYERHQRYDPVALQSLLALNDSVLARALDVVSTPIKGNETAPEQPPRLSLLQQLRRISLRRLQAIAKAPQCFDRSDGSHTRTDNCTAVHEGIADAATEWASAMMRALPSALDATAEAMAGLAMELVSAESRQPAGVWSNDTAAAPAPTRLGMVSTAWVITLALLAGDVAAATSTVHHLVSCTLAGALAQLAVSATGPRYASVLLSAQGFECRNWHVRTGDASPFATEMAMPEDLQHLSALRATRRLLQRESLSMTHDLGCFADSGASAIAHRAVLHAMPPGHQQANGAFSSTGWAEIDADALVLSLLGVPLPPPSAPTAAPSAADIADDFAAVRQALTSQSADDVADPLWARQQGRDWRFRLGSNATLPSCKRWPYHRAMVEHDGGAPATLELDGHLPPLDLAAVADEPRGDAPHDPAAERPPSRDAGDARFLAFSALGGSAAVGFSPASRYLQIGIATARELLWTLSLSMADAGRWSSATSLLESCAWFQTQLLGDAHPEYANTLIALSYTRLMVGTRASCQAALMDQKEARAVLAAAMPHNASLRTLPYLRSLAYSGHALLCTGSPHRAVKYYARALEASVAALGPGHPFVAEVASLTAMVNEDLLHVRSAHVCGGTGVENRFALVTVQLWSAASAQFDAESSRSYKTTERVEVGDDGNELRINFVRLEGLLRRSSLWDLRARSGKDRLSVRNGMYVDSSGLTGHTLWNGRNFGKEVVAASACLAMHQLDAAAQSARYYDDAQRAWQALPGVDRRANRVMTALSARLALVDFAQHVSRVLTLTQAAALMMVRADVVAVFPPVDTAPQLDVAGSIAAGFRTWAPAQRPLYAAMPSTLYHRFPRLQDDYLRLPTEHDLRFARLSADASTQWSWQLLDQREFESGTLVHLWQPFNHTHVVAAMQSLGSARFGPPDLMATAQTAERPRAAELQPLLHHATHLLPALDIAVSMELRAASVHRDDEEDRAAEAAWSLPPTLTCRVDAMSNTSLPMPISRKSSGEVTTAYGLWSPARYAEALFVHDAPATVGIAHTRLKCGRLPLAFSPAARGDAPPRKAFAGGAKVAPRLLPSPALERSRSASWWAAGATKVADLMVRVGKAGVALRQVWARVLWATQSNHTLEAWLPKPQAQAQAQAYTPAASILAAAGAGNARVDPAWLSEPAGNGAAIGSTAQPGPPVTCAITLVNSMQALYARLASDAGVAGDMFGLLEWDESQSVRRDSAGADPSERLAPEPCVMRAANSATERRHRSPEAAGVTMAPGEDVAWHGEQVARIPDACLTWRPLQQLSQGQAALSALLQGTWRQASRLRRVLAAAERVMALHVITRQPLAFHDSTVLADAAELQSLSTMLQVGLLNSEAALMLHRVGRGATATAVQDSGGGTAAQSGGGGGNAAPPAASSGALASLLTRTGALHSVLASTGAAASQGSAPPSQQSSRGGGGDDDDWDDADM